MSWKGIRLSVLGLMCMFALAACGSDGPSDADVQQVLIGTTHLMIGSGFEHSGFMKTDEVAEIERGEEETGDRGSKLYPIRALLKGGGKEGRFTYIFFKNEFGEWRAVEKD